MEFGVATADHQCEAFDPGPPDIRDEWERTHVTPRGRATHFWRWPPPPLPGGATLSRGTYR